MFFCCLFICSYYTQYSFKINKCSSTSVSALICSTEYKLSVCCNSEQGRKPPLRSLHTRGFAPGACCRGTLREQSSSVCTNDFVGILHPREQNFHPAKCSTIFNRSKLSELENAPSCVLTRAKWAFEHAPGAKPLVCRDLYKGVPWFKRSYSRSLLQVQGIDWVWDKLNNVIANGPNQFSDAISQLQWRRR